MESNHHQRRDNYNDDNHNFDQEMVDEISELQSQLDQPQLGPPLNRKNILNFGFFVFNFLFTYGIGNLAWFAHGTTTELSQKYQVRNYYLWNTFVSWKIGVLCL